MDADVVRFSSNSSWVSYYHDGKNWRTPGSASFQDNTIIRPDQAVFVISKGNRNLPLIFCGAVSVGKEFSAIPGPGEALIPSRFPTATTPDALQLHTRSGWKMATAASQADKVMLWNGAS